MKWIGGTVPFLLVICLQILPLFAAKFNLFSLRPLGQSSQETNEDKVRLWPSRCSGRVEVFHRGRWGTVCDDNWNSANSKVLCQEVGCGPVLTTPHGTIQGSATIWLDDLACNGTESSILKCNHRPFGENNCDHTEDAVVSCSDGVKLGDGTTRCSGALQVYRDGQWGAVCDTNWNQNLSKIVCKQLECGPPRKTQTTSSESMGYIGSCGGDVTSFSQCNMTKSSQMCHGVTINCEGVKEIRLVNGSDRCSGRVEIFAERRWGTVCDDDWDMKDAQVVCRAMDCGAALEAPYNARFGQGGGEIWLDNVECFGNESGLLPCPRNTLGDNNCGHSEDASVVCESQIRLVNGTTECSGMVEFDRDGQWSSARRSSWGKNEATVVCRQINCGEAVSFSGTNSINEPQNMYDVSCTGDESALAKCAIKALNQTTSGERPEDATVVCTGNVILSDGPNRCAGRVEVYHSGQWADICSDAWDMNAAAVVCRQLNCGEPHKLLTSSGRAGTALWVNRTVCRNQNALTQCPLQFTNQSCSSPTVAGIICSEGRVVRLANGQDRCSGRVEIRRGDEWGTLCSSGWDLNKAKFVCDLLECGHAVNISGGGSYPPGVGPVYEGPNTCFTSVTSIQQCSLKGFTTSTCGHNRDAGLHCGGDSSIRLINGTDRCSGRVEILYKAQWGTVCDDNWDISDAEVICRSKDCGSAIEAIPGAFFGQGTGNVWLDDVDCKGNETNVVQCQQTLIGHGNCGHGEDAGVICSAHLRLFGGPSRCSGNVEVFYNGEWSPAVSASWGRNEVSVVCREMNCGDAMSSSGTTFSTAELQRGFKVKCTGRESSISQCTVLAYTAGDTERLRHASVTCSGIVRLTDGPNRCAGRVEVFNKGQWGNVCGGTWEMNDAKVICQQLNCGNAFKITTEPDYGQGTGVFIVEHLECQGRESLLQQCDIRHGGKECNSSVVAGVVCADSVGIRLVDGPDRCSGRVEVRMGSVWGYICGTDWTVEKGEKVCQLLDCGHASNVSVVQHKASTQVSSPAQTCFSTTETLKHCLHRGLARASCSMNFDARVTCAEQVRLVDGPHACAGRVEVLHKGQWGTVCDDDWGTSDAQVVCRQLGCGAALSANNGAHFGRGSGPTWLDNVRCDGQESVLSQCSHNGWGNHNCGHEEDAGVTCLDTVQKPKVLMSPGTQVNWGERLDITCAIKSQRTIGVFTLRKSNDNFTMEKFSESETATFSFLKADFNQNGYFYCEYKRNATRDVVYYPQGDALQLTITVALEKPSISMTSPDPMLIPSKDEIAVNRGQRFNITCSTHSTYPGGFFYLTKAKVTVGKPKATEMRSGLAAADFIFSAAETLDQGNYSCVYGVNMSSRAFQSEPSKDLQVSVLVGTSAAAGVVITLIVLALLLGLGYFVWKKQLWKSTSNITDNMVTFVNRIGGAIQGIGNNSTVPPGSAAPASFNNEVYMDGIEEPPGTLIQDHEPLVITK